MPVKKNALPMDAALLERLAKRHGTPLYVYDAGHFRAQYRALAEALRSVDPLVLFSVKTNTNAEVVRLFAREGAGADVVSGGELYRALGAGVPPERIAYAGVGKTTEEIDYAIREDILYFTVESESEMERIAARAKALRRKARMAFRVNPDVDPKTHRYISTGKAENKFGLDLARAEAAYAQAARKKSLEIVGLHFHIGSQLLDAKPFSEALAKVEDVCMRLKAQYPAFAYVDIGGGLGIDYQPHQKPMSPMAFARAVLPSLKRMGLRVALEPGRFLVGNGGLLLTRVQYIKQGPAKRFVIVDAAMNDLIRPALYQAHHEVRAVKPTRGSIRGDVVGPVCESGDFFVQDRKLPAVKEGDLLAVLSAGAYGMVMASNYNSRCRPAEVLVDGRRARLIRRRETWEDLVRPERDAGALNPY